MSFNNSFMTQILEFADAHTYTKATFDIDDFVKIGFEISDRFISYIEHIAILGYISSAGDSKYPAGIYRTWDENVHVNIIPLRLTESGRSFLRARSKEFYTYLNAEQLLSTQTEFEHSYRKVIRADENGFQPALRNWLKEITCNPVLAGIMREVRKRTEFDVQRCFESAFEKGTFPQGNKQDEDVLVSYFMVKKVLDGDESQRKFKDTWILNAKVNFRVLTPYSDNLDKLVRDFKDKYVTFLSKYIIDELNKISEKLSAKSLEKVEKKPMKKEDSKRVLQKFKHLKVFFEEYNKVSQFSEDLRSDYEIATSLDQTEVDERNIRKELKKVLRILSSFAEYFEVERRKVATLLSKNSKEFMMQNELVHEVFEPPYCISVVLEDVIDPILFELEDTAGQDNIENEYNTKRNKRQSQFMQKH